MNWKIEEAIKRIFTRIKKIELEILTLSLTIFKKLLDPKT